MEGSERRAGHAWATPSLMGVVWPRGKLGALTAPHHTRSIHVSSKLTPAFETQGGGGACTVRNEA